MNFKNNQVLWKNTRDQINNWCQSKFETEKVREADVMANLSQNQTPKKDIIAGLVARGYNSDPVVACKLTQDREEVLVSNIYCPFIL